MNTRATTLRKDVPKEFTWATEDLFATDEVYLEAMEAFKADIAEISKVAQTMTDSAANLLAYLELLNSQIVTIGEIYNYASLKADEDTTNAKYQDFRAKAMNLYVTWAGATSSLSPKLLALKPEELEGFFTAEPKLEKFRIAIEDIVRVRDHVLDENGEQLMAMTGEMSQAPNTLYDLLCNADMKYEDVVIDGEHIPLSHGNFVQLEMNDDRRVREGAFHSFYKSYDAVKNTLAALLQSQMKTLEFNARARKFDSTLAAAVSGTNVDPAVYRNLITTVRENIGFMHDYVRLRKKALGVEELHMYDVYAPLVADTSREIPYDEAVKNCLETCKIYGDEYMSVLTKAFENRWVDRYENVGKASGAYSNGAHVHPFVKMNYVDNIDSEFTLIHEMGHSLHSYMSNTYQEPIYADYTMFVAEVASTCNEALLMQYLLGKTTDKAERILLINHFLEQFKGTIYRQTMFAEFELRMNELVQSGEMLTADLLCEEYRKLNEFYFGPDMVLDDEIALEWARIPHFYYNYYVYQYATGYSAAIALSTRMLKEGAPAVEDYLNFLKGGCTKDPVSLLRGAGVDMASPEPIREALKLFGDLIKEMDSLLD